MLLPAHFLRKRWCLPSLNECRLHLFTYSLNVFSPLLLTRFSLHRSYWCKPNSASTSFIIIMSEWNRHSCVCVWASVFLCFYQGSTTEQDHKDDEGFKPGVFYDQVAGLPQKPPVFSPAVSDGDITALVFGYTFCMTNKSITAEADVLCTISKDTV